MSSHYLCVRDCRHPLWGGEGRCIHTKGSAHDKCICDPGYNSMDTLGNASCVPHLVQEIGYLTTGLFSAVATMCLIWNAVQFWHLPAQTRATRRSKLRLRVLVPSIVFAAGTSIVFVIAAELHKVGHRSLLDDGMHVCYYAAFFPFAVCGVVLSAELWIDSLPPQIVRASGRAQKLKTLAREKHCFVWTAAISTITAVCLGASYMRSPYWTILLVDMISGAAALFMVVCALVVAVEVSGAINSVSSQAPAISREFYKKAKQRLWKQVALLTTVGIANALSSWLVHMTTAGHDTPIFPVMVIVLSAVVGLTSVVHFSRPASAPGSKGGGQKSHKLFVSPMSPRTSDTTNTTMRDAKNTKPAADAEAPHPRLGSGHPSWCGNQFGSQHNPSAAHRGVADIGTACVGTPGEHCCAGADA